MLIKADAGDKVTPDSEVSGNDKVTFADSDSSKMDSVIGRVNVVTLELKLITSMPIIPIQINVVHLHDLSKVF